MSQALPVHIEALIDHGFTARADGEPEAFNVLCEVADCLEAGEITPHQAEALLAMLGFSRAVLGPAFGNAN